jgi:hypothetical protein
MRFRRSKAAGPLAKVLGVSFPANLLASADEMIE